METQNGNDEINLEQSHQDWKVEVKLFNTILLNSNGVVIMCDRSRDIFEVKFTCQIEFGESRKKWMSYEGPKSVIMNISYKGVPICNITEQNVDILQIQSTKECINVSTKRLNSLVEIGKIQYRSSNIHYVTFKTNYSEQKSVCEKALTIQKML